MTTYETTLTHVDPLADLVGLYEALSSPHVLARAARTRAPEKERLYKARTRRIR